MAYIPNHLHLAATKWLYRNKPNIFVASASMNFLVEVDFDFLDHSGTSEEAKQEASENSDS